MKPASRLLILLLALLAFAPAALIAQSGGQAAQAQDPDPPEVPTVVPTEVPTVIPTEVPTVVPTAAPTEPPKPTPTPKPKPTPKPTPKPNPTPPPTAKPRATPTPTAKPKPKPTATPKPKPKATPTPALPTQPGVIEPATTPPEVEVLAATSECTAGVEGLAAATVKRQGRGLRFEFARAQAATVDVDVFQSSAGRRVLADRLIVRFAARSESFAWDGRRPRGRLASGTYYVRYRAAYDSPTGRRVDTRRLTVERAHGRFTVKPSFTRLETCETLQSFGLQRPVFGGTGRRPLEIAYRLNQPGRVGVAVLRGKRRVVRRFVVRTVPAGRTVRLKLSAKGLPRGTYRVRLTVTRGKHVVTSALTAGRL
jgi:outer membrane biosynthesis protein TonB